MSIKKQPFLAVFSMCRLVVPLLEPNKLIDALLEQIEVLQEWNVWAKALKEKQFVKQDLLEICL